MTQTEILMRIDHEISVLSYLKKAKPDFPGALGIHLNLLREIKTYINNEKIATPDYNENLTKMCSGKEYTGMGKPIDLTDRNVSGIVKGRFVK